MAHRPRATSVVLTRYTTNKGPEEMDSRLDYFLSEMEDIRREDRVLSQSHDEAEEEESESIDNEEDAAWLKKAGFESIVYILENTQGDEEVFESSELASKTAGLPKAHAAMIRQRMHTLRSTIRSKHTQGRVGHSNHEDIRNLFPESNNKDSIARNDNTAVQLLSIEPRLSNASLEWYPPIATTATPPAATITSSVTIATLSQLDTDSSPQAITPTPQRPLTPPLKRPTHLSPGVPLMESQKSLPNIFSNSIKRTAAAKQNGVHKSPSPDANTPTQSTDMKLSFCLPSLASLSESLPSIFLDPDPLGITMIDDLSPGDMEKIQCLAHIELSITFDENNIPLRTLRTPKLKNFEEKQFGLPLTTLLQNDHKRQSKAELPLVFKQMVDFLEINGLHEEGILRVCGSKQRIKDIQEEIETKFNLGTFSFKGRKPADVAALLKQFLRELPIPLLTREHLPAFASIADITDLKEQVRTLNLLILMLPPLHQRVLKYLLQFCEKIHTERDTNKMDITNISMVLAPNLFCSLPAGKLGCDDVTLASKTSHVVLLLIRYHYILWTVPSGMLTQVRFLYEYELKKVNERHIKQALQKMSHSDLSSKKPENSNKIIRVKAPLFTCVSKAVNIHENPTAGTVVAKLRKRSHLNIDVIKRFSSNNLDVCHSASDDSLDECITEEDLDVGEQFLYEVGGNIGERRLDTNTNMIALYEVNPGADWVIKPRNYPHLTL